MLAYPLTVTSTAWTFQIKEFFTIRITDLTTAKSKASQFPHVKSVVI